MTTIRVFTALAAVFIVLLTGCGKSPDELLQQALTAEKTSETARANKDSKAARRAANSARSAADRLAKLAKASPEDANLKLASPKAELAAQAARKHADIAQEEYEHRAAMESWSATLYLKSRPVMVRTLLQQLAAAADAAGKIDTNKTPAIVSTLANESWEVLELLDAARRLPDGSRDWAGASAQFSKWSTNQPVEFRGFLSLALLSLGQTSFALAEFETIDLKTVEGTNAVTWYRLGRTILYAWQGWNHRAAQEASLYCDDPSIAKEAGQSLVAFVHTLSAYEAGRKGRFVEMDAEIAQVIRAWPDSPWVVYLTGEKLAANGEWEKAASSLEASAAGTKDEWVAKKLADRARELRDGKGSTKAFALEARFLIPFLARAASEQFEGSEAQKKLAQAVEQAKNFGKNLGEQLPLVGGDDSAKKTEQAKDEPAAAPR